MVEDAPLHAALQQRADWAQELRAEVDGSAGVASAAGRIAEAFGTKHRASEGDAPLDALVADAVTASQAAFAVLRDEVEPLLQRVTHDADVVALCGHEVDGLRTALARREAALQTDAGGGDVGV